MFKTKILNSKGEHIVLNAHESRLADYLQKICNALGYQVDITTLTAIIKRVSEQKFFQIPFADYVPVKIGEGAWSTQLTKYRSFALGDDFENGVMDSGANNSRMASADAGIDTVSVKVKNWAKSVGWSLFDLQQAQLSGNWDLVTAKEKARLKNWQLGIQKIAFLGSKSDTGILGLLTQSTGVTINTSLVTSSTGLISAMSAANLNTFCANVVEAYRSNCNRTAMPTTFVVPESDYNGLASMTDASFPIKTKLQFLLEMFQTITMNKSFEILPCAYADPTNSDGHLSTQRYVLLNKDEDSVAMNIPVDYTSTLANSIDNFSFQNVGYGQFSGVVAYRPLEMLYIDKT